MASILKSPIEEAMSKAPAFGLPETFQKSTEGQQQPTFTPGNVPFQSDFNAASQRYQVPVNVLMALAQQESSFNPTALGQPTKYGRAKGLMQYIPSTAAAMGINPYDPAQSIDAAAKQLRTRLDQGYSMQDAVSAHFGGDDRRQWGEKTRAYGVEVMGKAQRFFDGTTGPIKQGAQSQQPQQRDYAADYPAAQSAMENMDQTGLRTRAQRVDALLSGLNEAEPDRYRALTPEEVQQYMAEQSRLNPQSGDKTKQEAQADNRTDLTVANQQLSDSQQKVANTNKGIVDNALGEIKDITQPGQKGEKKQAELKPWEPTLWERIKGLIPGNRDAAAVEVAARKIADEEGISVDEVYRSVGGQRPMFNQEGRAPIQALAEGAETVAKQLPNVPKATANAVLRAWRGGDISATDKTAVDKYITQTDIEQDKNADPNYSSLQGIDQSLGFTVSNLVPSAVATALGNLAAPAAGTGAGLATSAGIAYRASKDQFLSDIRKMVKEKQRREPTEKEWDDIKTASEAAAIRYGAWEAIPEALGNMVAIRMISHPLEGGTRAARLIDAAKRLGKEQAMEQVTETITGYGQNKEEQKVGLTNEDLSLGDAFRQQALQTAIVTGISGGASQIARAGYDRIRSRKETEPAPEPTQEEAQPQVDPAQVDPAQATEEEAVAAAPTPSRDDTGLSDDAGPVERALRGTQPQPNETNGNLWAGELGGNITVRSKSEPSEVMNVTVERYLPDGSVTVRDEHKTPYELSQDDVEVVSSGASQNPTTSQQMQDAGTPQEAKDQRAHDEEMQQQKRQESIDKTIQRQESIAEKINPGDTAIWRNADNDLPVKMLGLEVEPGSDGRRYARVEREGKTSFVPLNELTPTENKDGQTFDPATGEVLGDQKPARQTKTEDAPANRPLTDLSEDELRDRMRYFARQAKQSGWDTRLTKARREVETVLNAKIKERQQSEANGTAGNAEQQSGAEMAPAAQADKPGTVRSSTDGSETNRGGELPGNIGSDADAGAGRRLDADTPVTVASTDGSSALTGADGKPKWFSSAEKAQAHLDKKSLTGYTVQQIKPNRFELHRDVSLTGKGDTVGGKGLTLVHGSGNPSMTVDDVQIIRPEGQKQGKKGRVYGGFYGTSEQDAAQAEGYAGMMGGTPTVYNVHVRPGTKIYRKEGDITRLSENTINDLVSQGYGVVVGTDPRGRTEYAIIDKSAIERLSPRSETKSGETKRDMPSGTITNEGTKSKTPVNPRTNRAKKLVGDVGEIVSPDGDVGYVKAGGQYQITRIEKNGTVHVMNRETSGSTTITPAELERARSRNVNWSKTDVPAAVAETVAKSAPAETNAQQTAGSPSELAATTGAETIPYRTVAFDQAANNGTGGKVESSGTSPVINFGGRMMVLVRMGGRKIPFYLSTGKGGKADVPDGKWYPFFGIGADGWINKTGGKDMTTYYGSEALRQKAEELDRVLGDIRNDETVPKVAATGSHIAAINESFPNVTENGTAETLNRVRQSIADTVAGVANTAPAQTQSQQGEDWTRFPEDSGTLAIPRAEMPQIKAEHRGAMVNFLEARGVAHWEGSTPADTLKPTQAEFSPERVARAAENTDSDRSILVSSDGYVVDGHHQWLAARDNRKNVKAIILDAPVSKLLPLLHEFPSSLVDTSSASEPAKSETKPAKSASQYADERVIPQSEVNARGDDRESPWLFADGRIIGSNGDHMSLSDQLGYEGYRDMSHGTGAIRAQFHKGSGDESFVSLQLFDDQKLTDAQYKAVESFVKANDAKITLGVDRSGLNTSNVAKEEISLSTLRKELTTASNEGAKPEVTAPEYGADNKLVSQDRAAELRKRLKAKFSQLNSGIDPEILAIGTELAVFHIEASARKFSAFAKAMAADLDLPMARLRPYLRSWYNGARDMMEDSGVSIDGMDTPETVRAELAKLDQPAPAQPKQQPQNVTDARTTSGLDDMVSNFDAEVSNNGTATELDQPGQSALGGVPANEVRGAEKGREAGRSPAGSRAADGRGNEPAGRERDAAPRSVGDDAGAVPVSTSGSEPAGRGTGAERSRAARDNGDAAGRGRVRPAAGVTAQEKPADLFTINAGEIGQGGDKTKYANNVAAIRLLKELEAGNRQATADEQAVLAKYVGWGGLPGAFARTDGTANKGWEKQVAELKSLLTPEELDAAAASTRNAHYTSPEIVSGMWQLMERLGFTGGRVIEPSVGVGNFFGLMPQGVRSASALHGVELDRITSGIAAQLYPEAKIARMGYQEYTIPDGYFDAAVGNPPFGSEKLYDGNRKDLSGFSIHNYFFARTVDALRPGGVMAMVVTNRFLDATSDKARQYIADRADLLGAIRLPNNAFAKNAGTEVTTDIIVLQRRLPDAMPSGPSWNKIVDYTDKQGNTVPLNEYFSYRPEMMLGDFGAYGTMYRAGDTALVAKDGQNTAQLLEQAIARFPANVMTPAIEAKPETRETVKAENVRVGSMFVDGNGRVMMRGEDELGERTGTAVEFRSAKAEERVKGMIRTRDALSRLRQLQLSNTASESAIEEARSLLNRTYNGFVSSNGPINSQANKLLFRDDPTWPQISALEDDYDRGVSAEVAKRTGEEPRKASAKKAAIFTRRTQQPYSPPTSANSAKDALVASLAERGRIDMAMMEDLYGKTSEAIASELGDLIYNDPATGWQTRDAYLSGNVKAKLAAAEAAAKTDPQYARNVEALREVQPKDIEAVDISVKPGASWVPTATMAQFADHIAESTGSTAFYNPLTANWSFPKLNPSSSATARYGTGRLNVGQILEAAAAQKAVQVFDQHQDGSRTLNETETQLANDKVNQVKQEWDRWLWSDDTRRTELSRLYNDQFNTDVMREFDGSHLTFPGKISDDIIRLRPHQGNFVWRVVQGSNTLADHVVGAGKTFSLIAAAMELRRMGLARKPVFTVPNHLVGQWAQDFIKLYPGANVLAATKADFEKANRKRFFARIATGDWDAVIVAHSSFGKVGVKPETEAEFIREEIADLTSSIAAIEEAEGKRTRNVKQAQERKAKMEERLKKLLDTEGKDDSLYWDDLGIDALFVDEAHEFKNLAYSSGMRGVAGMGNPSGSQKATDMYMKTRIVRKATGGRNVVFATGTPISNTMAEMYTMQRYLDYDNLKGSGLAHFDAWARMFGEVVTDWELSPSGQYKMNSRFSKFVNMPELMQRYGTFADVINRDDINRQLAAQGKRLPVPKVKGGKPQNIVVPRSDAQADYIGEPIKDSDGNDTDRFPEGTLVYRAENLPKKAEKGGDNMLKIMSDARKAALDMRLIDPEARDNPYSKVNDAADRIKADYDRWSADRGTQLVFIDLSTPKGARADEAARIRDLVERSESKDPDVADAAQAELDKISPDEIEALNAAFSVYDDLKQKLVDRGIPAGEIAFIHDAKTDLQKTDLFGKVRSGRIRVLFGSTAKMGAGMNVQERLVALHHLDAPWRPSDLEQREGRIIRQGNKLYDRDPKGFEVSINRYATKQTLDSRMWQTIEGKANFIEQVRKGATGVREVEDIAGEAANAAEMKAASSGNPLILEEMTLRQRIRTLENERTAHDRDQFRIRDRIRLEESNIRTATRTLGELRKDVKLPQPAKFEATIDGQTFDKRKDAGEAIISTARGMEQSGTEELAIGSYGGFKLSLSREFANAFVLHVKGSGDYQVKIAISEDTDPTGVSMRMTNAVKDLDGAVEQMEQALQRSEKAIPGLQEQVKAWPKSSLLEQTASLHAEVIEKLRPKKKTDAPAVAEPATQAQEPQQNDLPQFGDWDTSYARLPEGNRIQLNARLRKLQQQQSLGQISPEQYSDRLAELADWLEQRTMENAAKRAFAERQRGADMVLERLHRARRQGEISEHAADIAIWALNRNPQLADDLGISIRGKGGSQYDRVERIARLMTENMRDTAPIHEILHHTERMLPPGVQKGIAAEYNAAWKRAYKNASPELRAALDALRLSAFGDKDAREATMKAFESGLLQYHQHYQLTNASEYWAVNASEIMANRHVASKAGWVARAREWMREFIRKAKSLFGLPSDAAVLRGLDAVMKGDGSFQSSNMLAVNPVADTPLRDQQGDYADQPRSDSGMDPAPDIPTPEQDSARLKGWWDKLKNLPQDKMTDAMQKGLAVVPMRPLVLELGRNLPAAAEYMRLKQSMDAMRNTWHARTDAVAQRWLKYRKSNKDENVKLMDLMHEATLLQVDPSQGFLARMTDRDRDALRTAAAGSDRENELLQKAAEDNKRREDWQTLNDRFKQLSPEAQGIFSAVRDEYSDIATEYEKVLMGNMEKAINVRIKKAEREHRYELQRITDEGLTGKDKQEALDEANRKLKIAKTKTAWNRKARITQLRQQFEMERLQGPYFPLARFGNLFVTVRDAESGRVESFSRFEKASEQREFADLMRQNPKYKVQVGTLDDTGATRKAVDANFVADVEDILADLPNAEQVKDEVWQRYLESLPDFSIRKNRIHRTGRKGFIADALRAYGNQMFHSSHQLARLKHTFDMEEALDASREEAQHSNDPVRDGMVVNEMEKRHEFVMNPKGGPLVQKISQASFIYFLAASPKAAIVNLSQTAIMGVPILGAYDGSSTGMVRAANQLMRALGDFTRGKGQAMESKRLTGDERKAMQEAYDTGIIDRSQSHDLAGIGETGVEYSPARTKVMGLLAWGFHQGERLNREVTFLAAYRMAKAKGLPHNEAVAKANDLTWKTHFDYQNTSRPRVMHSDTMKALLVFRNFSINMLWRLFRDLHQATKGDSPEVRREARIQLAGTTGMMMLNAGITGTWFFGIAMMIAGMFMDKDDDPEEELKKNMIEALGPQMAGIILDGVPGYLTGTSLSDSIGMRDLWFRDPSTSLEGKGAAEYWKSQLLGAPPSIVDNAIKGYQMIQEGQVYRGIETLMPKALKDPMKAYRYATEGATNKRGDVIVDDIDAADVFRQALGFTPAKLAEQYDLNNAGYNRQDSILKQRKKLMDDYWKADEAGDSAALDKLETEIDKYNDKYPEMEITPKTLSRSAKTREKNAEDATGGMRYNRKLRDRILDEQSPTIYR